MEIDWSMLMLNLRRHKPLVQISYDLGKDKDYCGRIARGAMCQPRFSEGIELLDMHLDLCGVEKHKKLAGGKRWQ